MSAKCGSCGKTAYPMESLQASGATFHKLCFKCTFFFIFTTIKRIDVIHYFAKTEMTHSSIFTCDFFFLMFKRCF